MGIHGAVTSYADAVARVAPAVVTVRVDRKAQPEPTDFPDNPMFRRFFGERMPFTGAASRASAASAPA